MMKKIRILFFIPFMNGGGAERVILTLLTYLDRDKYELILVMMKREGRYLSMIPKDIEVIDLKASQARYAVFKIIKVIREKKPDVVFSTLAYLNLIVAMIRPFFSKNITFIARESNTVSVRNKREKYPRLFDWLYKNVYKNFDIIVTQAKYMRDDLVKNYGLEHSKMFIIYNPVDTKNVAEKSMQDKEVKLPSKYNLLAVGKLGYQKGYDILFPIMTRLDDSYHVTILGEGADKDKLEKQIKELGLESRVSMLGFSDNPFAYMKKADLLVLPSRYEGLANVILEANYCGTPTVAFSSPGGVAEIVHDGKNGFLVEPFDEEAFAKAIKKAREYDFDEEAIMIAIQKNFAIEKIIKEYDALLSKKRGV